MQNIKVTGNNIWIHKDVIFGTDCIVGHNSCIGYGDDEIKTTIENNVKIGAFCIIEQGAVIKSNVEIDHYCRIGRGSHIGYSTKLLYGAQIFDDAYIGNNCIIGGNLVDRIVIEDNVTYMGEIAHSYRNPNLDWDTTVEPSPIIKQGSVIGVNALIIGGIVIGPQSYIAAGEIVRHDIPPRSVLYKGNITSIDKWKGVIKVRN